MEDRGITDEEIKSWAVEFIKEIPGTESGRTTPSCSIFEVPERLNVKEVTFLPEIFPLGPFGNQSGRWRDKHLKMPHFFRLFGGKVGEISGSKTAEDIESQSPVPLDEVFKAMIALEGKMRECYDGLLAHGYYRGTREMVKMMVLDGCFIIELMRLHYKFTTNDEENQLDTLDGSSDSPISAARWALPSLLRDLMKLQNQFPFFVLQELFSMTTLRNDEPSLRDLFVTFFSTMLSLNESIYKLDPSPTRKYAHPLDLCRSLFVFPIQERCEGKTCNKINPKLIYSVKDLHKAGVTLIRKKDSNLLDISFDKGVLKIPPLSIDDTTTTFLLNFVAYELCDRSQRPYFTNYLLFLDTLIDTTKEIVILRRKGIIRYPSGTEQEVVDLFHKFCTDMRSSFDQKYFLLDMNAVNNYCKAYYDSKWHIWWTELKKERFSSPWKFLSLVAAIVLLILTMLQTLYTIIPYYHPN